MNVVGVIHKPW